MKDTYKDMIEDLLAAGMTADSIYEEAKRMQEAKDAAKVKLVDMARNTAVDAVIAYVQALSGDTVDKNFKADLIDYLKTCEKAIEPKVTREEKKCCGQCTCKTKSTKAADPLADFLKEIGAL